VVIWWCHNQINGCQAFCKLHSYGVAPINYQLTDTLLIGFDSSWLAALLKNCDQQTNSFYSWSNIIKWCLYFLHHQRIYVVNVPRAQFRSTAGASRHQRSHLDVCTTDSSSIHVHWVDFRGG
jgi:hypothetical protein